MIVDTSALVAIAQFEDGRDAMLDALDAEHALIPAPVVVEFNLVTSGIGNLAEPDAQLLLAELLRGPAVLEPFTREDAALSPEAHRLYGRGNGRGGELNMLDIMVYCMARRLGRPILCTGRDFASTDAEIHPASRPW